MSNYNSYRCGVNKDCSEEFLRPISTFILGTIINFRHLIYLGFWYMILCTPILNSPIENLPNWLGICIATLLFVLSVYCVFFNIIPKTFKNIASWVKIFKARKKLPIITIDYSKAKTLISNLDNFTCGEINIMHNSDYCLVNSYRGVDEFLGFFLNTYTAFKGSIFSTILIKYSISVVELKKTVLGILEKHAMFSQLKKEKKYSFKKDLARNEQKAVESLLEEIEKKKKKSEKLINQAVDDMGNVFRD